VAEALPRLLEEPGRGERQVRRHVQTCLRCQAELARYRRMQRMLGQLRSERPPLPPGAVRSALAAIEERAALEAVRAAHRARRLAAAGAGALVAGATVAAVVVGRTRSARAARAS
jgi:hypothetical protein